MTTVVEGLMLALSALPKADKVNFVDLWLYRDPEAKSVVAEHFGLVNRAEDSSDLVTRKETPSTIYGNRTVTSKEKGRRRREAYIATLVRDGLEIRLIDGVWARTSLDLWVPLPFATEGDGNRWFLGLPQQELEERAHNESVAVVLLCEPRQGPMLDFVIPPYKVQEVLPVLSKSKNGQVKFNIKKVGSGYHLLIPGGHHLDISDYLGERGPL
jgi:hypothetical protein